MELVATAILIVATAAIILAPVWRHPQGRPALSNRPRVPTKAAEIDARLEAEIAAARGGTRCPSCGATLRRDARFCSACGVPVAFEVKE